jgi:hypothetical protein
MTYSPVKPDSGPSPKIDAPQIQTNFSKFASIFSKTVIGVIYNHTAMNDSNQGDHESIILEKQLNDPGVTQNLDVIYCKDVTSKASIQPQLFVQIPKFLSNEIPNTPMQLTYNTVNIIGPNQFQSFLPGGYILYFGTTANIAVNITLVPAPTQILLANSTATNMTAGLGAIPFDVSTTIISNDTFKINSATAVGAYTFLWMAIAKQ